MSPFPRKSTSLGSFGFLLLALSLLASAPMRGQSTTVVIDQVYGGGGGSSTTTTYLYNQDYVELFNLSAASVNIGGWAVQYMSAAGTSASTGNVVAIPSGTILAPGQRYLVAGAASSAGGTLPVTPDITSTTIALSSTAGKVFLTNNSTALASSCTGSSIVDYVGYGTTASCFEGTTYAPAPSTTTADVRVNSCVDTNQNGTDFATSTAPNPRSSASTATPCGGSTATAPSITSAAATPSTVTAGSATLLTASVTKGTNNIAGVTVDTSALGGSTTQPLYDDGTHGDVTAGDGKYSYSLTVPGAQTPNTYTLNFKVTDTSSLSGTGSTSLIVQAPVNPTPLAVSNATATPSTVTAGGTTIFSVAVTPGTLPTSTGITVTGDLSALGGSSTQPFYDDGTHGDATANDGTYSYALTTSSSQTANTYIVNIKATDAQARTASTSANLTVQPPAAAAATVSLSASTSTAVAGSNVTFTAVVQGNKNSTPTGTVQFLDGGAPLGPGTQTSPGTYILSTTSLSVGTHNITAVYSGDGVYPTYTTPTPVTVTITTAPVPSFTLSLSNTSIITSGNSRIESTTVNVAMTNGFSSKVSFACSGLPSGSRCTFSPPSLTASGSSVLTIGVDGASLHRKQPFNRSGETALAFALLALPLAFRRKLRQRLGLAASVLSLAVLAVVLFTTTGCSSSGNSTPTGSSTITVTAMGGGVTQTATVTLVVQ